MSKYRSLLMILCVVTFLFVGCNTNIVEQNIPLSKGNLPKYDDDLITIGFIQTGKESDWRDANTDNFLETFTKQKGYNLIYVNGYSSPERQIKVMYDFIAQNVDYIILQPIVETGWEEVLQATKEAGITVIISDREVNIDNSLYACWVGGDFYAEGVKAVDWLTQYLKEIEREDETINIVILEGTNGATATIGRTAGLTEQINLHSNWNIIASECANFTQGEGKNMMEKILEEHNDIDVLISENDNMAFGAMKAMDLKNISYGVDGEIIIISFDALYEAFEKMIEGKLHATIECNPLLANLVEEVISEIELGHEISKTYYIDEGVFSYKNAAEHIDSRKY